MQGAGIIIPPPSEAAGVGANATTLHFTIMSEGVHNAP